MIFDDICTEYQFGVSDQINVMAKRKVSTQNLNADHCSSDCNGIPCFSSQITCLADSDICEQYV